MAKTLDDLYNKLDEILNSLSSVNDNMSSIEGGGDSSNRDEIKKAKEEAAKEREKKLEHLNTLDKHLTKLWDLTKKAYSSWKELEDQSYKTGRAMGYNAKTINQFFHTQLANTQKLAAELGITHQALDKLQASYSNATNRARTLTTEQMKFVGAMSKLVGEATVTEMLGNMDKLGASSQTAMARLAKARYEAAKFGLNANKTSEAIAKNIKLASSYNFKGGTSELAKMVVESEKMKVNFDSMVKASEKFGTLDSAITTSANIQVLGGSFAREFSNPLEAMYEATSDQKSFMERLMRTMQGKGTFNKETGEVQFDPVTRRLVAEFGKQIGMSTEELINMASSQITRTEIDNIVKGQNLGKDQLEFLKTSALFNAETQKWVVNRINKNGESEEVDITTLSNDDIKEIQRNTASEENAFKDIQSIRDHVAEIAKGTSSGKEAMEGASSQLESHVAEQVDDIGQWVKGLYQDWGWKTTLGVGALSVGGSMAYGKILKNERKKIEQEYKKRIDDIENGQTRTTSQGNGPSSKGKDEIKDPNLRKHKVKYDSNKNLPKDKNTFRRLIGKAKGKGKLVVGAGALLATVFGLSAVSNGTSQEVNTQPNEVGSNGDPILDELKKHTEILSHMSGGIDKYSESSRSEEGGYGLGGAVGDLAVGLATDPYIATSLGIKALGSKLGQKTITNIVPKLASKLALGSTTKALAGPLGWGGLAVDGINMLGQGMGWWEEGGAVAKTLDIGGSALTGAGVGALVGVSDDIKEGLQSWDRKTTELLDSDSIGDKLLGGISWVGHTLVENTLPGMIANLFGETEYDRQEEAWEKHMKATREQQEAWETQKLGQTSIADPMLQQKAAYATIKTHDQIITWYRAYMGLNSDATDEVGELKKVEFEDIYRAHEKAKGSGEGFAEGGIVGGSSFSGDKLTAKVNSGEMILNKNQQANLFSLVAGGPMNTLIRAKEVVGQPQYISPSAPTPTINSIPQTTSVNVNVNGTLKLESNNNSLQIDLTQLLNNPQFKQQIVDMVTQGINERSNGAVRVNRDSPQAKSGGAIGKTAQINM